MGRKAFLITISVLLIILAGMFSSCGDLVPEYEGRINPNDPNSQPAAGAAVKNVNFSMGSMADVYWNVELADFSSWDADAPKPQFFVIVFSNGDFDSKPEGKLVLAGLDYATVAANNYQYGNFQMDRINTAGLSGSSIIKHTLAVFWTDQYQSSMDTLSDADPLNDDFSGNWQGPKIYARESTLIVAGSGGSLDGTPMTTFDSATFTVDQVAGSYGLLGFDFDTSTRFDNAVLFLSCQLSAMEADLEWSLYNRTWDTGDPAADLWLNFDDYLTTYAYYGSSYLTIDTEFFAADVTGLMNDWASSGGNGIALIPGANLSRVFYGTASGQPPYILLTSY